MDLLVSQFNGPRRPSTEVFGEWGEGSGVVAHILSATTNQDPFLYIVTLTPDKHPKAGPCEPSFQKGTLKKAPVYTDSLSATLA